MADTGFVASQAVVQGALRMPWYHINWDAAYQMERAMIIAANRASVASISAKRSDVLMAAQCGAVP